jgi:hypothetical protein
MIGERPTLGGQISDFSVFFNKLAGEIAILLRPNRHPNVPLRTSNNVGYPFTRT